jgi:hypothetical protein
MFTQEQMAAIQAAENALYELRITEGEASTLLIFLKELDKQTILTDIADGNATFAAALVKWGVIKADLTAKVNALP